MRKRAQTILLITLGGAAALLALAAFSLRVGFGIPCIFHAVTGLLCPGCGGWRMSLCLLQGDFAAAFAYNPALFLALPVLAALFGTMAWRYIKTGRTALLNWQNAVCVALIVYFLVFAVWRNLL